MGFGFNLFFVFILLPFTVIFTVIALILGRKKLLRPVLYVWIIVIILVMSSMVISLFFQKKVLNRNDIYGEYIIDRDKFSGKQADWQYDHFRFEINKQNEFIFYQTEKDKVLSTSKIPFSFLSTYKQPRINLHYDTTRHHIIADNPTLYRTVWGFYYVFQSSRFGNVFFKKGSWKAITE